MPPSNIRRILYLGVRLYSSIIKQTEKPSACDPFCTKYRRFGRMGKRGDSQLPTKINKIIAKPQSHGHSGTSEMGVAAALLVRNGKQ